MNRSPLSSIHCCKGGFYMEYEVFMGGQPIGKAVVERQGLYYSISCRCRLSGEVVCKVTVSCGENTESLGILVPEGGAFILTTRIPIKRLGEGELSFRAEPRHTELRGKFVPISPESPFAYISRLENAFLEIRQGQPGVLVQNTDNKYDVR